MDRVLVALGALVTWAISSAILVVLCLLSVSEQIITGAMTVAWACLAGSALFFILGRDAATYIVAAIPGAIAAAILAAGFVVGQMYLR